MEAQIGMTHLQRARLEIRQALDGWNAADLDRIDISYQLLVAAAGDLRIFETAVRSGAVAPTPELYANILAVKQDIMQATRLVDACVAFHRGLAARTGAASPVYDAEGRLARETAGVEPEVHA